jgi:hypothetical protein
MFLRISASWLITATPGSKTIVIPVRKKTVSSRELRRLPE